MLDSINRYSILFLLIFFMLASEFTDFKTIDMVSPNQKIKK